MPNVAALQAFMQGLQTGASTVNAIFERKARADEAEKARNFSMSLEKMGIQSRESIAAADRSQRWEEVLRGSTDRRMISTMEEEGRNRRAVLENKIREKSLDQNALLSMMGLSLDQQKFGYEKTMGEAANIRANTTLEDQLKTSDVQRRGAEQQIVQGESLFGARKEGAELQNEQARMGIAEQKATASDRQKLLSEQAKAAEMGNQQNAEMFPIRKEGAQVEVDARRASEDRAGKLFPFDLKSAEMRNKQESASLDLTQFNLQERQQIFAQNAARFDWEKQMQPLKKEMAQAEVEKEKQAQAISSERFDEWKASKMKPGEGVAFLTAFGIDEKRAQQIVAGKTWSRDTLLDSASKVIGVERLQLERDSMAMQGKRLESDLKTADLQRQIAADRNLVDMEKADYEKNVLNPAQLRIMDLKERGLNLEVEKAEQDLAVNQRLRIQGGMMKAFAHSIGMPEDFVNNLLDVEGGLTLSQFSMIFGQMSQIKQFQLTSQQMDEASKANALDSSLKIMRTNVETMSRLRADIEGEIGEKDVFAMLTQAHQQKTQLAKMAWQARMEAAQASGDEEMMAALAANEPQVSIPTLEDVQKTVIDYIRPRLEARIQGKMGEQYQMIGNDGVPYPMDTERVLADLASKYTSQTVTFNQDTGRFENVRPKPREGDSPVSYNDMTAIAKDPRFRDYVMNVPRERRDEVAQVAKAMLSVPTQFDDAIGIKTHDVMKSKPATGMFDTAFGSKFATGKNTPVQEGFPTDQDFKPVWESWRAITRADGPMAVEKMEAFARGRWNYHMAVNDEQATTKRAFGKTITIPSSWEEARKSPDVMRYLLVDSALDLGYQRSYKASIERDPSTKNWQTFHERVKKIRAAGGRFSGAYPDPGRSYNDLPHKRIEKWISENWE